MSTSESIEIDDFLNISESIEIDDFLNSFSSNSCSYLSSDSESEYSKVETFLSISRIKLPNIPETEL